MRRSGLFTDMEASHFLWAGLRQSAGEDPKAKGFKKMPKHRGHNEGSIFLRKDGRWCAVITLPDTTRKYYYGKIRTEVQTKIIKALADLQRGLPPPAERQTVERC